MQLTTLAGLAVETQSGAEVVTYCYLTSLCAMHRETELLSELPRQEMKEIESLNCTDRTFYYDSFCSMHINHNRVSCFFGPRVVEKQSLSLPAPALPHALRKLC